MQTKNIHLLLVEDNSGYLTQLIEWLNDYGYRQIQTASSVVEATEKLCDPFDVIIADMRMEQDNSGFVILEEVKARNLSSVVIILTANDNVIDCRNAFKLQAWDYISKTMRGNVFDALHDSIQEAITYFNRWGNVHNEQWITENLELLEKDYWGKYIAVINKTVIETADNEDTLNKLLEERKLRRFLTTIRKIGDLQPISQLIKLPESPKLEYKSTLQWDVRQNRKNEDLKFNVLKTIAAFLNSEGGTLIIGVEDDGNIFGLEQDLATLSKGSLDQFKQTIVNLICDRIGPGFMSLVTVRFETIQSKTVCAIDVRKSDIIAVMQGKDKKSELYIRAGNTSKSLDISETVEFCLNQNKNNIKS
ncbi:putative DNA binding domain-containing protein [Sphaerospermopsis sp. FACHB-1094]|uniref:RNA-binding domain-containing protein n=1 Tax=Sphaerospermopsis sp. FACHB-1094 TaxID=2692861 RepID=UPI00168463DF|nr:RNA-binding domain-containing protein [Sphaerospermopsis sp. FACHB-1094]MBD2131586.1 putative DNA binding domain-containing protein [Sphaerospermopsis sp. FACHB-1094]